MSAGKERQKRLRARRAALGWVQRSCWVPLSRAAELPRLIEAHFGRPPGLHHKYKPLFLPRPTKPTPQE